MAILAIGALAAASATAALPEFRAIFPTTFTGTSGTVIITEAGGATFSCDTSSISGEIVGAKEVAKVVLKFNEGGGGQCQRFCETSPGHWETRQLKGRIAYLSAATKTVGLLLEAVTEPITTCKHYTISGAKIQGSVIAEIGPVNRLQKTPFSLKYETTSRGEQQVWRHFEGEERLHRLTVLPAGGLTPFEFTIQDQMTLTAASAVEIRA